MGFLPKVGDVIRYDYLWDDEARRGREEGSKDRPCAVVFAVKSSHKGKKQRIYFCAITHSPPKPGQPAIELTPRLSRHIGLDGDRAWIKTHEVNFLEWGEHPPVGVIWMPGKGWTYGELPEAIALEVQNQVKKLNRDGQLKLVRRR